MRGIQAKEGASAASSSRSEAPHAIPDGVANIEGRRPHDEPELDLPPGLAKPALRALHAAGYTRLDQLAAVTETDLGNLHGMGPKAIGLIRESIRRRGKSFTETKSG